MTFKTHLRKTQILHFLGVIVIAITTASTAVARSVQCIEAFGQALPKFADTPNPKRDVVDTIMEWTFGDRAYFGKRTFRNLLDSDGNFKVENVRVAKISSETGSAPLAMVRLNIPDLISNAKLIVKDYAKAMRELPDLQLLLVGGGLSKTRMKRWVENLIDPRDLDRIKYVTSRVSDIAIWAQDGSKPLADEYGTLSQSRGIWTTRPEYRKTTAKLRSANINVVESDLPFEGGNVIVGDRHVFIGSDMIEFMMTKLEASRRDVLKAYERQFGRPVIEIGAPDDSGKAWQPEFHIDLFMAVVVDRRPGAHKNLVLLQSTELLDQHSLLSDSGLSPLERETVNFQEQQFRAIQSWLESFGYEVVRIPGSISPVGNRKVFSYTNAIFSGDTALVPQYGIPKIDELAYDVYRKLGYRVIPMASSVKTIKKEGAIRCVSETYRSCPQSADRP